MFNCDKIPHYCLLVCIKLNAGLFVFLCNYGENVQ